MSLPWPNWTTEKWDAELAKVKLSTLAARPENAVHVAADSQLAKMSVAIRHAFAKARAAVNTSLIHADSTPEDLYRAMAKVPDALETALLDVLPDTLLAVMAAGGSASLGLLKTTERYAKKAQPVLKQRFDATNVNAVAWAHAHAAELAKGIADTTRQDIAAAIERALQSGDIPHATADIFAAVGDANRAELIARTEIMTAANEGQRQSWDQAVDAGLLSGTERREWIATETACPLCLALNGSTAKLGESYPAGGGDGPPLHPRCRCTEGIHS